MSEQAQELQYSEGTGQEMQGTEHPADGTPSPTISNEDGPEFKQPTPLDLLDHIKDHIDSKFGTPTPGMSVTHLHRTHEHWLALRQDLEHLLHMSPAQARGEEEE